MAAAAATATAPDTGAVAIVVETPSAIDLESVVTISKSDLIWAIIASSCTYFVLLLH